MLGGCLYWLEISVDVGNIYVVFLTDAEYVKTKSPDNFVTVFINPLLLEIFKVEDYFNFQQSILILG